MAGNLANLQKATAARTAAAIARAQATLDAMTSNTQIRFRIEQLRTTQQASPRPGRSTKSSPDEPSSVVRALTAQLADLKRRHREETTQLRQALEQAHGENLLLRRRLGAGQDPGPGD